MQYKDILLYIDDGASNAARVEEVFGLARDHGATVTGVTLAAIKPANVRVSGADALKDICDQCAQDRLDAFIESARDASIAAEAHIIYGGQSVASRKLAQYARNFDLVVLRQSNPSGDNAALEEMVAEQVILLSGRPVFFMPYIGAHRIPCLKAAVAWDGTPAASRALHDALPMLVSMDEVMILIIEGNKKTSKGELLASDLTRHLKSHGVNATVNRIAAGTFDVPTVILNEISDNDIDVLVMGGYGTPSLQQKIFGGVTKTLLASMTVPVIMSH
ncbi:MAG: universal stress protein [Gammaproteobacteria bacterium]|nr:universal stress protein [Gammaproteobacteria bacterium]